jgi:hypothetical protein
MSGWTAAQTALILVAVLALFGAVVSASLAYTLNQLAARRDRRGKAFAEALAAVEDFAEMPYRVRRRRDSPDTRHDLGDELSRIQSRLAYHQALIQVEAPAVAAVYAALVRAAKVEAGGQIKEAWQQPAPASDAEMNIAVRYSRDEIDTARSTCVHAMRSALGRGRFRAAPAALPTANSDPPP